MGPNRGLLSVLALAGLLAPVPVAPHLDAPTVASPKRRRRKHRARVRTDNPTLRRFRVTTASGRSWKVVRGAREG